jgi:hypothetical protein
VNASSALDGFGVEGFGVVRVPFSELASLRKNPGPSNRGPFHPILRHADEQSVLAVAAVLRALDQFGWQDRDFEDWAVLAAPRYLGRARVAACWDKFSRNGVRGVTPWAIPNLSLHAMAGTVTMILQSHGPNFGVGGSEGHLSEAFEAALSFLDGSPSPGAWLVLTEWSPEAIPDEHGEIANQPTGYGVALALSAARETSPFVLARRSVRLASPAAEPTLEVLSRFLPSERDGDDWSCPLAEGILEIRRRGTASRSWAGRLAG